jgi:membrane-associated phospholipid phosphatase
MSHGNSLGNHIMKRIALLLTSLGTLVGCYIIALVIFGDWLGPLEDRPLLHLTVALGILLVVMVIGYSRGGDHDGGTPSGHP